MNKKLLLVILFLCICSNAQATVRDFWTSGQQSQWTTWKNEGDSSTFGYKMWHRILAVKDTAKYPCDSNSTSGQAGIAAAIYARVTGDTSYATAAYNAFSCFGGSYPAADNRRNWFINSSLSYSYMCGGSSPKLGSSSCSSWNGILKHMTDNAQADSATRLEDSDQLTGDWVGSQLHLEAQLDNEPVYVANERAQLANCSGSSCTWGGRNTGQYWQRINDYFLAYNKGEWVEGTEYSPQTMGYIYNFYLTMLAYSSTDWFPELTNQLNKIADYYVNSFTTDLSGRAYFGDVTLDNILQWKISAALSGIIAGATGTSKDNACWLQRNLIDPSQPNIDLGYPFAQDCTSIAPTGVTGTNATGRDIAIRHFGWTSTSYMVWSSFREIEYADHNNSDWDLSFIAKGGAWLLYQPLAYYNQPEQAAQMANTLLVNGIGAGTEQEARGQIAYRAGTNYMYHVGSAGGNSYPNQFHGRNGLGVPPEFIHEDTRHKLDIAFADGSISRLFFDRVNSTNPFTLARYDEHKLESLNQMNAVSNKHEWQMWAASDPTFTAATYPSPDRVTWVVNGSNATLDSFIPEASTYIENNYTNQNQPFGQTGSVLFTMHWRFRLEFDKTIQHHAFGSIFHWGSSTTNTQYTSSSGELAKAYKMESGSENILAVFDAADRTADLPTESTISGGAVTWDSDKLTKLNQLRFFKTGYTLNFTVDGTTTIFLLDLDPHVTWNLSVDGAASYTIIPGTSGLYTADISFSNGSHTLVVSTGTGSGGSEQTAAGAGIAGGALF